MAEMTNSDFRMTKECRMTKPEAHTSVRLRIYAALLLLPLALTGCLKPLIFWGYLLGGPPSIEPDFDLMTKKSMTDKEATVAVVRMAICPSASVCSPKTRPR